MDHLLSTEELQAKFKTNLVTGLTQQEAEARFLKYGPNSFTPPKQLSNLALLFKDLFGGLSAIMWLCAVASLVVYFLEWNPQDVNIVNVFWV